MSPNPDPGQQSKPPPDPVTRSAEPAGPTPVAISRGLSCSSSLSGSIEIIAARPPAKEKTIEELEEEYMRIVGNQKY
jgi:hypothetical protein